MHQPVMRFCPTCGTDVEDVGGVCMLGHSLKVPASTGDLNTLKAEVDAAFEEAKLEVAAALGRLAPGGSAPAPTIPDVVRLEPQRLVAKPSVTPTPAQMLSDLNGHVPTAPAPATQSPTEAPKMQAPAQPTAPAPKVSEAPQNGSAQREITTPPPPPSQHGYTSQPDGVNDPITAFSPPPHMDWGPQRARFRRRK